MVFSYNNLVFIVMELRAHRHPGSQKTCREDLRDKTPQEYKQWAFIYIVLVSYVYSVDSSLIAVPSGVFRTHPSILSIGGLIDFIAFTIHHTRFPNSTNSQRQRQ